MTEPIAAKPRVVVLGAGFAGLALLRELRTANAEIVVVDRRNYHLFQPLLYEVATAALTAVDIAQPIRAIVRGSRNTIVCLDEAVGIDTERQTLRLADAGALHYDILVVASGVDYNYFGHDEWSSYAPSLKSAADAIEIRRRLLLAFEAAERTNDLARRRQLLTFVLVGGGPTGVELAGAIADLARGLPREFRRADPATARVILLEAGPRLLSGFSDHLGSYTLRELERLHVEVRLSSCVEAVSATGVETSAGSLEAGLVVWCAGVRGSAPGGWLGTPTTGRGTVPVTADLSLAGHPEIFIVGDLAHVSEPDGEPLPNLATVAKQEGAFVGRVVAARLAGKPVPGKFIFHDPGALAVIGRASAIADFDRLRLTGFPAWVVWACAHIFFLIGFRNRSAVFLAWAWEWLTRSRSARLIVDRPVGVQEHDAEQQSRAAAGH